MSKECLFEQFSDAAITSMSTDADCPWHACVTNAAYLKIERDVYVSGAGIPQPFDCEWCGVDINHRPRVL
jgi:aspartate carbamoyltransferase regulatory subunit